MNKDLNTEKIPIRKEVWQGDSISPKLFTLALEDVFKKLAWEKKRNCIDGKHLNHWRFAFVDDMVLLSNDVEDLRNTLTELKNAS